MNRLCAILLVWSLQSDSLLAAMPDFVEDQFEIPPGFKVYRAADSSLTGTSLDITFDGQGRLLVGDGRAVRRLVDDDGDGIYDRYDVIAEGLGGRGPQGLLVYGDRLYAVGGDGVQLFEGYEGGGPLVHRGRIGEPFNTGGDHAAHTVLRGHDGFVYFVTGDGGGTQDRRHINQETSPALFERKASVFRFSTDGSQWECVSAGGRNPPNVGMNYLGELFSWDSDMEWHVDLPFYRPLHLNHWIQGGDQGWQGVGAYPPYYIDTVNPVMATGRGSPTWGIFYEHRSFPAKYRDAYFVCDYLWKSATSGQYNVVGRLVSFFLTREGSKWTATMEVFARPKKGAFDGSGEPINFGLVDVDVAPDGSIFVSDHNQGVWRIFHDPGNQYSESAPPIFPSWPEPGDRPRDTMRAMLTLPQPAAEWSRLREVELKASMGERADRLLRRVALNTEVPLRARLRAIRLLAPEFSELQSEWVEQLANIESPVIRAQAAWLLGLRSVDSSHPRLSALLGDSDPFVRRRAAEALTRTRDAAPIPALIERLNDPDRLVRYAAMNALAHRDTDRWFQQSIQGDRPQTLLRALTAANIRRQWPDSELVGSTLRQLIAQPNLSTEDRLDALRVLAIFQEAIEADETLLAPVSSFVLNQFPSEDANIRWEQVRLIGQFELANGFGRLLDEFESESDPVAQFHIAGAISKLDEGWSDDQASRLRDWFVSNQSGWFAEFAGKGRQFPEFWATVLNEYVDTHHEVLLDDLARIDLNSQLGEILLDRIVASEDGLPRLIELYNAHDTKRTRLQLVRGMSQLRSAEAGAFLRDEFEGETDLETRNAMLRSLAELPFDLQNQNLIVEGAKSNDLDTAAACTTALQKYNVAIDEAIASALLNLALQRPDGPAKISQALVRNIRIRHPRWMYDRRGWDSERAANAVDYWQTWYQDAFGKAFVPAAGSPSDLKSNDELVSFLAGADVLGGDVDNGRRIYQRSQCRSCHGGEEAAGMNVRLFGPDLSGVTRRLSRVELAEAIVFPSKTIEDRFKGIDLELTSGEYVSGFKTDENATHITMALQDRVRRIPKNQVESSRPQTLSLMPEGVLNTLTWQEIRDLYAYIDRLGTD